MFPTENSTNFTIHLLILPDNLSLTEMTFCFRLELICIFKKMISASFNATNLSKTQYLKNIYFCVSFNLIKSLIQCKKNFK